VTHLRARRLVSSLPDGLLPARLERRVRAHLVRCAACRTELAALEGSAALLRRLPRSLVPLRSEASADERLAALARWGRVPASPSVRATTGRSRLALAGRLAPLAATVALALLLGGSPSEVPEDGGTEAFNFVLAGSLVSEAPPATSPAVRVRSFADDGGQVARAWIHPPSAAYLPPGPR
jgi:anti-sigma factor RsiW